MKLDIRQILDIFDNCGYTLVEKGSPQSPDNWKVDSVYEFESESKKVVISFTIDPTPGYLSSPSRRKQKNPVTLDCAEFEIINKESGELAEYELDLRNSSSEEINRVIRLITL